MPALDLSVALRIIRGCLHVGHAADADELFEVFGDELGAVVADDAWARLWVVLARPLQDAFHVAFRHGGADVPVNAVAATTVEYAEQIVESTTDINVGHVDMPMF